ncbi:Acg family FMN-binding oxidoreductase [Streptomyces sp. 4F14]|uniref:Acg family FMN-binding oxidoreductase n=1 Tax=Streptomyces sp. 4F14 TaxID=3394380 RepID=UPI003A8A9CB4
MWSTVLSALTAQSLVSAAVAAPSVHNTQPWRFRLTPDGTAFEVRAAAHRGLRHIDPMGRALHVSVGCAVLNLRVAVARFGREPVTRLLPSPGEPELLATVRLGGPARGGAPAARLYEALWYRHSSRLPFSDVPVPRAVLTELAEAAHYEGAVLSRPGPQETERLLRLTWDAEHRNTADADRAEESRHWVRGPDGEGLGLPPGVLGPQDFRDRVPLRDFGAHRHPSDLPSRPFERCPVLVVLSTAHDRRADWLRAGQALERLLLVATAHGLRASLLHQSLEWPDLREQLVPGVDGRRAHAQMVIRLGYGPEGAATPRRPAWQAMDERVRDVPGPRLPA